MKYADGAYAFYRALAQHLISDIGVVASVQLVIPKGFPLPEGDCIGIARALATRNATGSVQEIECHDAAEKLPGTALVIDCRECGSAYVASHLGENLRRRSDIVVIVTAEIANLGCDIVSFAAKNTLFLEAVTAAFRDLLRLLQFRGDGLEMPFRFISGGLRRVSADFGLFHDESTPRVLHGEDLLRFCRVVSQTWSYCDVPIAAENLRDWALQFEPYGFLAEAEAVLMYIHRLGYLPKGEITNRLIDLFRLVADESPTLPQAISIQRIAKSESMLLYELRRVAKSPPTLLEAIARKIADPHLVCFDDVIGSGDTILRSLFSGLTESQRELLDKWLQVHGHRITVIVSVASVRGITAIEDDPRCRGNVRVRAAQVLGRDSGIFSSSGNFFSSPARRDAFRALCRDFGERLYPIGPLGWDECSWCIVTDYNVPNCSLPVIWARGSEQFAWTPLFPRR